MRSRICLAVGLPLLLVGVAGCGGGDSTDSTPVVAATPPPPALSKEELIDQGNAICAEVNAAVGTVSSTSSDAAGRASQAAQLYSGMVDRLKGLGTPDETAGYPEFISTAEDLAQAESDARLAAERGESAGMEEAEAGAASALASFQSAALAYGFEDCGEEPSAPVPGSATPAGGEEAPSGGAEATEPEAAPEAAPETGGAGAGEEGGAAAGGGAATGGGTGGGAEEGGGGSSGGIGPG